VSEHRSSAVGPQVTQLTDSPRNAEGHLRSLMEPVTPTEAFYIRSNFPTPLIDPQSWRLRLGTGSGDDAAHSLAELKQLSQPVRRIVTLECAGNGRTLMSPQPDGTPWTLGAVGTAHFTGIPLSAVLPDLSDATEVLCTAHDRGEKEGVGQIRFQRSLPVAHLAATRGTGAEPILAWEMNGAPLSPDHGGPLRLVVPGWYAVASVKWLDRIELLKSPFSGYFQTNRYRYLESDGSVEPVTRIRVRALVLKVGDQVMDQDRLSLSLPPGQHRLTGSAWSGGGAIEAVEVSTDGGARWVHAILTPPTDPFGRTAWQVDWMAEPGVHQVIIRARDTSGAAQPLEPVWNALGYGNNVAQRVTVQVG